MGLGVDVRILIGEDGYPVVQIGTDSDVRAEHPTLGPEIRVHLNDCCVYNTTPLEDGKVGW